MITILQKRKVRLEEMKGLHLHPSLHYVPKFPVSSKLSFPSAEQAPTFRTPHNNHHFPLFSQILDFR